jgi:carboxyl-terminal processing protease
LSGFFHVVISKKQEVDKTGRATIYINDGVGSETETPLYVLVDQKTASASEILTAALQDNHRATVVGGTRTFGKGRIQNVQPLASGGGIAITKAKYLSPNGRDIQSIGISPDIQSKSCGPTDSAMNCLDGVL